MSNNSFKIGLFGLGGVGKSCIAIKYVQGQFMEEYDPTIADNFSKLAEVDNRAIQLTIFDTAGMEGFTEYQRNVIQSSDGFLVIFAVDDAFSFSKIPDIIQEILRIRGGEWVPIVICANKCDKEPKITISDAELYAKDKNFKFLTTSAKDNTNIDNAFKECVREIWKVKPPQDTEGPKHKFCNLL